MFSLGFAVHGSRLTWLKAAENDSDYYSRLSVVGLIAEHVAHAKLKTEVGDLLLSYSCDASKLLLTVALRACH